jgi:hypothetical protein
VRVDPWVQRFLILPFFVFRQGEPDEEMFGQHCDVFVVVLSLVIVGESR